MGEEPPRGRVQPVSRGRQRRHGRSEQHAGDDVGERARVDAQQAREREAPRARVPLETPEDEIAAQREEDVQAGVGELGGGRSDRELAVARKRIADDVELVRQRDRERRQDTHDVE